MRNLRFKVFMFGLLSKINAYIKACFHVALYIQEF